MSSFLTESPLKLNNQLNNQNNDNDDQYLNENLMKRKIEFDKGNPLSFNYCSNKVRAIPYNINGFRFFIWEKMLNSPFNIFLLFILLLYLLAFISLTKEVKNMLLGHSMTIYFVILIIEFIMTSIKYISIYCNDSQINNMPTLIYNSEKRNFDNLFWKDIRVGNIIKVKKEEIVPADIIILETMDLNHICNVDYSSINGIFDSLAIKKACNDTFAPSVKTIKFNEYVQKIKGSLKYEEPNSNLNQFNGKLKLEAYPRASEITDENFIMRGSTIKNIKWVYGLVVYTGMETKVMQTLKKPEKILKIKSIIKKNRDIIKVTLKFIQYFLIGMYSMILILLFGIELHKSLLCYYSFLSPQGDDHTYLEFYSSNNPNIDKAKSYFVELFLSILQYLLTFNFSLPFTWFGLIRIAYFLLCKFIQWDTKILLNSKNKVEIINKNTIADFGQIRHVLTDKTGTLTQRKFQLKICSINGKMYSFDPLNKKDENYVFQYTNKNLNELELYQELKSHSPCSKHIKEFMEYLCLCHTVKVSSNDNSKYNKQDKFNDKTIFGSSFAEEKATLKMINKFGYVVKRTKNNRISLQINNNASIYDIVGVNEYSSDRQRMSVVVKTNIDELTSVLLCKANDFSVFPLCKRGINDNEIAKTKIQIKEMVKYGLRFFIFCRRILNEEDTTAYMNKFKSAENFVVKSDDYLVNLALDYEKEMEFLGVLFFKEKVIDNLKYSINKLNANGIKVWIVSGDRKENVISVGKNLDIFNPKAIKGDFSDKDKPEDLDIKMSMLLMQYLFPNEKINKMKTRKGVSVEAHNIKGSSKDLTILINGECFTRICNDERNYQSLATLLSYCSNLLAYSFSQKNKYELCQMIKRYVSKNTKVLAVGDGFNDFMMLKEADISIGIRSKEILQVRNSCDIIVDEFTQIIDLILVHGTWNFQKLLFISLVSFYANLIIIFPIFLHQNACNIGSTFYINSCLKLSLDILAINLSIIFLICFDYPVERSIIKTNTNIYKDNFYDLKKLVLAFGFELIKAIADSLILYYLHFLLECINSKGETVDQLVIGCGILNTAYAIIFFKIFTMYLKTISYLHFIILFITIALLISISCINTEIKIATKQGMSYIIVVLNSFLILTICFLYEFVAYTILNYLSHDFVNQITKLFKHIIKQNMLLSDFGSTYLSLTKDMPVVISKIDKITYPEVLSKLSRKNHNLHPALESMADVSNEEVALLKIKKPLLHFCDEKIEEDFIHYRVQNTKAFGGYLLSMGLICIVDIFLERFPNEQLVSKITTLFYLALGMIIYVTPLFKYKAMILFHYFFSITLEIISIYVEKSNNDTKIYFTPFFILSFPLIFPIYDFTIIFLGAFYYLIAILPSIYLNDLDFSITNNQPFFLYSNLPLCYHRNVFLCAIIALLMFVCYHSELECRIEFLKYQKCEAELKKDNLIMMNLIPEFVRKKLKDGIKEAALGYEMVSIIFCEICDFDSLVTKLTPKDLIRSLDELYSIFDQFCLLHGLQKIETVGKTYMAVGGIEECELDVEPSIISQHHAIRCFEFGMDILDLVQKMLLISEEKVKMKIGIHTGEVIPAVVGNHKPQFSLIGDTVNTTSRMCSYSSDNCINCSQFAYEEIKNKYKDFTVTSKEVKGKGRMNLYLFNPKPEKNPIQIRSRRPRQSSNNVILKSFTKKCPVLTKQPTKTSARGGRSSCINNNYSFHSNKKNSFENSNRIIDNSIEGFIENKVSPELKLSSIMNIKRSSIFQQKKIDNKIVIQTNEYLDNSFLFLKFKNNISKNGFLRYERQKFLSSENLSILINMSYLFNILFGVYEFSQYALVSKNKIAIYIALKAFFLIILVGIVYQTKFVIHTYGNLLSWLNCTLFFCITIVIQVQMNFSDEEFLVNLAIEEMLTLLTITMNGMLNYQQNVCNILVYIVLFIINACINYGSYLILKYSIFLITECIVCLLLLFLRYYYATFEFAFNQKKAKVLAETEKLLFNMMPLHVVQNLKDDTPVADVLDSVTMLYADIVKFTDFADCHKPIEVVKMLCELFKGFDDSTKECFVYKVHTIGDCYVVMGFNGKVQMNERNYYEEARNVCKMGDNMIKIIRSLRKSVKYEKLDIRIGIHTGPVIAGIIGSAVVRYDILGSDVLIANKMEAYGLPGKINISEDTKRLLEMEQLPFTLTFNQTVQIPSIGKEIKCYFIDSPQYD